MDHTGILKQVDGKLKLVDDYWKKADLSGSLIRYSPEGAITESFVPDKFIFTMEGSGALDLKDVLRKAIEIFIEKVDELDEQLGKVKIIEDFLPVPN